LGNITDNNTSVVVALDVSPKLLGLGLTEGLVLVDVVVSHDPVSELLELLLNWVNLLN
jgi:hypothetical protein